MSVTPAHVLVTGGCGFVLAPFVRRLLRDDPHARVTVVDLNAPNDLVRAYLADVISRVEFRAGDLQDPATLSGIHAADYVVHGAAATLDDAQDWAHTRVLVGANVGGTLQLLEWLRRRPAVRRVIHVSSGAVYGDAGAGTPEVLTDEAGPVAPRVGYAVTKAAGEQLALRFAELHDVDVRAVRLASVFGPMERPTGTRGNMSMVYRITRAHLHGGPVSVSERSLRSCMAPISSEDVAAALSSLLRADRLDHAVYNVASGYTTTVAKVLDAYAASVPGFRWSVAGDPARADVDVSLAPPLARAHVNARLRHDVDWEPRALGDALREYAEWARVDPGRRCPALGSAA